MNGARGYTQPLQEQLKKIGDPLISKMTSTTKQTGGPPLDLSSLMMMLYFMGVFGGKPPGGDPSAIMGGGVQPSAFGQMQGMGGIQPGGPTPPLGGASGLPGNMTMDDIMQILQMAMGGVGGTT